MKSKQLKKTQKIKYKKTKTMKKKQKGKGGMFSNNKDSKEDTLETRIQQYAADNKELLDTFKSNDKLDETFNTQKFSVNIPREKGVSSLSIMPNDLPISNSFDVIELKNEKSTSKKKQRPKGRGSSYKNFSEYMDNIKYRKGEQPPHFGGKKKKGK
jgi:hypothetical protein